MEFRNKRLIVCAVISLAAAKKNSKALDLIIGLFQHLLSQPNNNHNTNNKTTITVVGLRLSNRWEPPTHPPTITTNSKLHDRAEIEQNSENKSY